MTAHGWWTMTRINGRGHRRATITWLSTYVALAVMTAASIAGTYSDQADVDAYAAAMEGGSNVGVMTGAVAGLNTLGGVIANELSVIMATMVPLMALSITSRMTRKDEHEHRADLLLAGPLGGTAHVVSALLWGSVVSVLAAAATALAAVAAGADVAGSLYYATSTLGLGLFFVGVAALAAQLVAEPSGVFGIGLAVLAVSFAVRGASTINDSWWGLLTAHGLSDEVAAYGDNPQLWPFAVLIAAAAVMGAAAFGLRTRRDIGAAIFEPRAGNPRLSAVLATAPGAAFWRIWRPTMWWLVGVTGFMAFYGSMLPTVIEAFEDTPELQDFLQTSEGALSSEDALFSEDALSSEGALRDNVMGMFAMMAASLVAAYGVSVARAPVSEESTGRLALQLSGPRSRTRWWLSHCLAVACGTSLLSVASFAALGWGAGEFGRVADARLTYAAAIFALTSLALFATAIAPHWGWLAWGVYAVAVVLVYLGPALDVPDALVEASPLAAAGNSPAESTDWWAWWVMVTGAVLALILSLLSFSRRSIPRV